MLLPAGGFINITSASHNASSSSLTYKLFYERFPVWEYTHAAHSVKRSHASAHTSTHSHSYTYTPTIVPVLHNSRGNSWLSTTEVQHACAVSGQKLLIPFKPHPPLSFCLIYTDTSENYSVGQKGLWAEADIHQNMETHTHAHACTHTHTIARNFS